MVDNELRLVGIITINDIVDVIEEETTEDIYKMASTLVIRSIVLGEAAFQLLTNLNCQQS